jgi:hypothetical protein
MEHPAAQARRARSRGPERTEELLELPIKFMCHWLVGRLNPSFGGMGAWDPMLTHIGLHMDHCGLSPVATAIVGSDHTCLCRRHGCCGLVWGCSQSRVSSSGLRWTKWPEGAMPCQAPRRST